MVGVNGELGFDVTGAEIFVFYPVFFMPVKAEIACSNKL
jgi:hypothetical protein